MPLDSPDLINLITYAPDFLLAVLSCWLGLGLLVRAPYDRATRAFAWFSFNLALYGLANMLPQLTTSPAAALAFHRFQLIVTCILPASFLHFIAVLTTPVQLSRGQWALIGGFYATASGLALYALFGPLTLPAGPRPDWSRWGAPRFPPGWLSWAWTGQRVLPLLTALVMMLRSYRSMTGDSHERRLRRIFAVTTAIGIIGALAATIARSFELSPALPRALIVGAMLALAYAVFSYRALLPPRVAQRAFFYSVLGSLFTTLYVGLLLGLEYLTRIWFAISAPVVTVFALVVLAAVFGPVSEWFRGALDRRFFRREFNYGQLLRTLGNELFERGDLADQLQAALAAICRVLDVRSGLVVVLEPGGLLVRAQFGSPEPVPQLAAVSIPDTAQTTDNGWEAWPPAALLLPLRRGEEKLGLLVLGARRSGLPFSSTERVLLDHLSSYLVLAIVHAQARAAQELAISELAAQSRALQEQQEELARQAAATRTTSGQQLTPAATDGLRVYALGPLRVERNGEPVTRWGGDKAGTYQAEALFAFLFDRRGKGITKDEAEEVIWPDLEISKADTAFHRTINALRRTLEPGLRRGNESRTVLYHHERYWLEPAAVAWTDVDAFRAAAEEGASLFHQERLEDAVTLLEQALALYRADYMDDCPFFGDSIYVEEQRAVLRAQCIEVLLMLGVFYEAQGRSGAAGSAYRRALSLSPDGCTRASEGLQRLGSALA